MKDFNKFLPLFILLVLAIFIIPATVFLALTSKEPRIKAASSRRCIPARANCRFDIPCCSGLRCLKTNIGGKITLRCLPGPTTPTVRITLSCVPEGGTISLIVGIPEGYPGKATRKCCEGLVLCEKTQATGGLVGVCRKSCEGIPTIVRPTPWECIPEGRSIPLTPEGFKMQCCPGLVLCPPKVLGIRGICQKACELKPTEGFSLTPPVR